MKKSFDVSKFSHFSIILIIFIVLFSVNVGATEPEGFNLENERYSLSITPKLLEDGAQNDLSFNLFYTDEMKFGGEIRLRTIKTSGLGDIWEITDSMLTLKNETYEAFVLPLNYQFIRGDNFSLRVGLGAYYNFNKSASRGYFNDSSLYEPEGPDNYNAYVNDFSAHAVGPMLDVDFSLKWKFLYISFSGGVTPVFYFNQSQSLLLSPLMGPSLFSVAGGSASGPYYYLNLDVSFNILNYACIFITLFNEYSRLSYESIGFIESGGWAAVNITEVYKTFALEVSLLINLKADGFMPLIGYGRTLDGKNYFMLGVKKLGI